MKIQAKHLFIFDKLYSKRTWHTRSLFSAVPCPSLEFHEHCKWHCSQGQPHLASPCFTLLYSLLILILEQLPPLCQRSCFCSWLVSRAGELIWLKTELFSVMKVFCCIGFLTSSFQYSFPHCSGAWALWFPWDFEMELEYHLMGVLLYLLGEEENSVPVLFSVTPCRKVNTWSL